MCLRAGVSGGRADSCEHGTEPSGSIKFVTFLYCLRNHLLVKKGSVPISSLIRFIQKVFFFKSTNKMAVASK